MCWSSGELDCRLDPVSGHHRCQSPVLAVNDPLPIVANRDLIVSRLPGAADAEVRSDRNSIHLRLRENSIVEGEEPTTEVHQHQSRLTRSRRVEANLSAVDARRVAAAERES